VGLHEQEEEAAMISIEVFRPTSQESEDASRGLETVMKAILFALLLIIVPTRAAEADTWEGNFCGAHRSAILELQSHSSIEEFSRIIF
jgi:hypothetical protein